MSNDRAKPCRMILHRSRMVLSIEGLYIRITCPRRGRSQIPFPLLRPLLLLLLLLLRLSFHVQFLAGEIIRHCLVTRNTSGTPEVEDSKELLTYLALKKLNVVNLNFCKDKALCNGSGRLAEISTMMILLPASLVILISLFSRR